MVPKQPSAYDEICKACGACDGGKCFGLEGDLEHVYELPEKFPQTYDGYRFTSDAMDCALPISLDSHSGCEYSCAYCFANSLQRAPDRNPSKIQKMIKEGSFYSEWPIRKLEQLLARELKDPKAKAMYPLLDLGCPVQLGTLGEPFDGLEAQSGWMKQAVPLFIKYNQPVRISTKGATVMLRPDYMKVFEQRPDLFWVAFSIISNSDELLAKLDIKAPVVSERLKAMKAYSQMGCKTSLRFRPFLPGVSDAYPGEPEAWAKLMERSRESGANAVSFEYIFLNSAPTDRQKALYRLMFRVQGNPKFGDEWNSMSNSRESCRRGSRLYKYDMTLKIRNKAHALGMAFGCSDPHFKEFNDYGCCCGIAPDDPVFGNWSRRQMTNVIVDARKTYEEKGERRLYTYLDWWPEWAYNVRKGSMIALMTWHRHRVDRNATFGDHMRNKWNNPKHPRGPYIYFGGVLKPVGIDDKTRDVVYVYRPWHERFHEEFPWETIPVEDL